MVSECLGKAASGTGRLNAAALASTGGARFNAAAAPPLAGSASFFVGRERISRGPSASESPGRLGHAGGGSAAGGPACCGGFWVGGGGGAGRGVTFLAPVTAGRGGALTAGWGCGAVRLTGRPAPWLTTTTEMFWT